MSRAEDNWYDSYDSEDFSSLQDNIEAFFERIIKENVWETKDWNEIDIDKLEDSHRRNIINRFMRKKDVYLKYVSKEYFNNVIKVLSYK